MSRSFVWLFKSESIHEIVESVWMEIVKESGGISARIKSPNATGEYHVRSIQVAVYRLTM